MTPLVHGHRDSAPSIVSVTAGGPEKARLTGPLGLSGRVRRGFVSGGVRITPHAGEVGTLPTFISSGITQAGHADSVTATPVRRDPHLRAIRTARADSVHAPAHKSSVPTR